MVMAGYGIYQGVTGLRERDKNYITCKVGIAVCSALSPWHVRNIYQGACLDGGRKIQSGGRQNWRY